MYRVYREQRKLVLASRASLRAICWTGYYIYLRLALPQSIVCSAKKPTKGMLNRCRLNQFGDKKFRIISLKVGIIHKLYMTHKLVEKFSEFINALQRFKAN